MLRLYGNSGRRTEGVPTNNQIGLNYSFLLSKCTTLVDRKVKYYLLSQQDKNLHYDLYRIGMRNVRFLYLITNVSAEGSGCKDTLNWSDITPICELITELDFITDFDLITKFWRFP